MSEDSESTLDFEDSDVLDNDQNTDLAECILNIEDPNISDIHISDAFDSTFHQLIHDRILDTYVEKLGSDFVPYYSLQKRTCIVTIPKNLQV